MKETSGKEPSTTETVFGVDRIRKLVELMKEHDLSEIDLRESRQRIRICRGPKEVARPAMIAAAPAPAVLPAAAPVFSSSAAPAADSASTTVVKSPMVGTYYSRPKPGADTFVKVGSKVDVGTPLCIIEAMKVFNPIESEVRGTITAILVDDGEAVEFDKPLFKIDTAK